MGWKDACCSFPTWYDHNLTLPWMSIEVRSHIIYRKNYVQLLEKNDHFSNCVLFNSFFFKVEYIFFIKLIGQDIVYTTL